MIAAARELPLSTPAALLREISRSRLGRRFLFVLIVALTVSSLVFLVVFVTAYRNQLLHEHRRASTQLNELLRVSLENAMLKRDLPGLRSIVQDLGRQPDVATVMIVNPAGEVRFSSDPALLGRRFDELRGERAARFIAPPAGSVFTRDAAGEEVLRTINPVHNQARCAGCHGLPAARPLNGILVVDYVAGGVRRAALGSAFLLAASGACVLLATVLAVGTAFFLLVLRPVRSLAAATTSIAAGDLTARVRARGDDELALLGRNFDAMADRVAGTIERLRDSEAFLQSVIDAVPDGVRVIGDDFTVLKINRAYCSQHQTTPETAIGNRCYTVSHGRTEPCLPTMVTCPLVELQKPGQGALKCRHRHVGAQGRELFVEVSAARVELTLDGRRRFCVIESVRDLADQARISHEQRLSEIGQLAAGVAHEIHNPLSSIQLALAAVRQNVARQFPDSTGIDPYLDIVDREINRCIDVTGRLLRLSEPGGVNATLVDIASVVGDVVSLVAFQAAQAGVRIHQEIEGPLRSLGSESDFGILILNLVQNALHAMPEGGDLTIRARDEKGTISIAVADTGIGIAAEDLPRIFWPFWSKRADNTRGAGLGLAICKSTAEQLGGRIEVHSSPGRGSCFTIVVPARSSQRTMQ